MICVLNKLFALTLHFLLNVFQYCIKPALSSHSFTEKDSALSQSLHRKKMIYCMLIGLAPFSRCRAVIRVDVQLLLRSEGRIHIRENKTSSCLAFFSVPD